MNGYGGFIKAHLPHGAFDTAEPGMDKLIAALASGLDSAAAESAELMNEADPSRTNEILPRWEVSYGITPDANVPYSSRVTRLIAAIRARGGLSRQYFADLAFALGYQITIDEFVPAMCGWAQCGDVVYDPLVIHVWNVSVSIDAAWKTPEAGIARCGDLLGTYGSDYYANLFNHRATCGVSRCGDRLITYSNALLTTLFNELKPAHTYVNFTFA